MPYSISRLTIEHLRAVVTADRDLTVDPVHFALVATDRDPEDTDWTPGEWEPVPLATGEWVARVLTGPGTALSPGDGAWALWIRITDSPERPVRCLATILVT